MTGPEHYQTAEQLLVHARETLADDGGAWHQRQAQAHATLALAAATALAANALPTRDHEAWHAAAGTAPGG